MLEHILERYDLLKHPFYRAWADGTLPVHCLRSYAAQWGAFVGVIDQGWSTLGREDIAAEEREHALLWEQFAQALDTQTACPPPSSAANALQAAAAGLFAHRTSALGALYAFEAQQPRTASSKLQGLREHYTLGEAAEAYFAVHADDHSEPAWLKEQIAALAQDELETCHAAAAITCKLMWDTLTQLHAMA